jgi:cell cycle serine/threonine-protein kinase CDC5/MSD2
VYEVKDNRGSRNAIKVVTKTSLKTKKAKTKVQRYTFSVSPRANLSCQLYAEIKIHRSLHHPNIVKFNECFEDDDNVYMTLELCDNGVRVFVWLSLFHASLKSPAEFDGHASSTPPVL